MSKKVKVMKKKQRQIEFYTKLYYALEHCIFTRKSFTKLSKQLAYLSIYTLPELRVAASQLYIRTLSIVLIVLGLVTVVTQDPLMILLMAFFSVVAYTTLITEDLNNKHTKVIQELGKTVTSIREQYTLLESIPDALTECERHPCLNTAIDRIYNILCADDSKLALEEFNSSCPFPLLSTLAGACYIISETGESRAEDGISNFKQALNLISEEIDLEIRKRLKSKHLMFGLKYLPLFNPIMLGPLQALFTDMLPGTAGIYQGVSGYVIRLTVVIVSMIAYYILATINNPDTVVKSDEIPIIDHLSEIPSVHQFISKLIPKSATKRKSLVKLVTESLTTKDMHYIYTEKVLLSVAVFTFSIIASVFMVSAAKNFTYNSISSMSLGAIAQYSKEETDKLRALDKKYVDSETVMTKEVVLRELKSALPSQTDLIREEEYDRMVRKRDRYYNTYYHWYYVLISYCLALIAWQVPTLELALRKILVKAEQEEDVLQMQTIVYILKDSTADALDVLEWLERQSRVHKHLLRYASLEYTSNPERALTRLSDSTSSLEFKKLCSRLKSAALTVSLRDAFADLKAERVQVMKLREMSMDISLERREAIAKGLAMGPLFVTVFLVLLYPITLLAAREFIISLLPIIQEGGLSA